MGTATNVLFLLIPEKLVGVLVETMLVVGALALIVGARKAGQALVISAIAFPLVGVFASFLFEVFFAALPEWMVMPIAFLIMMLLYLSVGWMIIKAIFGQRAVDHAKGELLADGVRKASSLLFSKAGMLSVFAILTLSYIAFAYL